MITFIIVGKNEEKTLQKTFESVCRYTEYNKISEYEIIYVDSKSTDNSIQIAKEFENVRIFSITGEINSAIARNIGARESTGSVLIFLDADMEFNKDFYSNIFYNNNLCHPFISGRLLNVYYDKNWNVIDSKYLSPDLTEDRYESTNGGYFIILKHIWDEVGGMNTKYRRSQDWDFALRLAKRKILLLRKKEIFAIHHTVDYFSKTRMWRMLLDGSILYGSSVLYREHLTNKYIYKLMARNDYTMLVLAVSLICSILFSPWYIFVFFIAVYLRAIVQKKVKGSTSSLERFLYFCIRDAIVLAGTLFFYPKNKQIMYIEVDR